MRLEFLGPCPQPLSRELFRDLVFNSHCRLLQVASQQLNMEETGKSYDHWRRDFFLPRLWATNHLRLSLDYVRFKTRGRDECSVPHISSASRGLCRNGRESCPRFCPWQWGWDIPNIFTCFIFTLSAYNVFFFLLNP